MHRNHKYFFIQKFLVLLCALLMITPAQAGTPLWTFTPLTPTTYEVLLTGVVNVIYTVQNQSPKPKLLAILPTPGVQQETPCQLSPKGQPNDTCTLTLTITGSQLPASGIHGGPNLCQTNPGGSPNPNQCYQPSTANILNITREPIMPSMININSQTLVLAENSTGEIIVTNSGDSLEPSNNIVATIPVGSNITVQSTTCPTSLAIGASCSITFSSGSIEGPTTVSISGDNTNRLELEITVTDQPQISISSPIQQERVVTVLGMTSLSLEVTNNVSSEVNANDITIQDHTDCPDLVVNDTDCSSVAPGANCTLELTSNTPYTPCMITISGSNTANSPQTLIAFSYLDGLVFEQSGGIGKVVMDVTQESPWTSTFSDITTDFDNGVANTNAIVADDACTNDPENCAAHRCRAIDEVWYLPALNELSAVHSVLCMSTSSLIPCTFGGFSQAFYWSSTQGISSPPNQAARTVFFPAGSTSGALKTGQRPFRCIRNFTL